MALILGKKMHTLTMSIADAAKALNVSRPTVYKLINDGSLQTFKIGHRRLTTPEACRDYIRAREMDSK